LRAVLPTTSRAVLLTAPYTQLVMLYVFVALYIFNWSNKSVGITSSSQKRCDLCARLSASVHNFRTTGPIYSKVGANCPSCDPLPPGALLARLRTRSVEEFSHRLRSNTRSGLEFSYLVLRILAGELRACHFAGALPPESCRAKTNLGGPAPIGGTGGRPKGIRKKSIFSAD